jgi:3-hydroxyacyl-CoA dehydrogenase
MVVHIIDVEIRTGIAIVRMGTIRAVDRSALRFLEGLCEAFRRVSGDGAVDAIVLGGADSAFFGVVDVCYPEEQPISPMLGDIVNMIERCSKPVVAAIHGTALGWELELALGCHFRISAHTAKLGLPDVRRGLMPGAGGTQRLPRAIGPELALEMMVRGKIISGDSALEIGLIDATSEHDTLLEGERFVRRILAERRPIRRLRDDDARLAAARKQFSIFTAAASSVLDERTRILPAPLACIEAAAWSLHVPFDEALARERQAFKELWNALNEASTEADKA